MTALLLAALFVEVGLALIFVPWTSLWDRNYFAELEPHARALVTSHYLRGAVSGLGLVNLGAGVSELLGLFASRSTRAASGDALVSRPSVE
jgi:hypothetical protein